MPARVNVIDSHTGGEPTRLVIAGGPDLGAGPMAQRLSRFREEHDSFRSAVVNEPRGSDVMVGALLQAPCDTSCGAGVIFFNNVGCIGMCGHGTIGLVASLAHLGRLAPGRHRIETPVGVVTALLHDDGDVSVENVPSFRHQRAVRVCVRVHGDSAVELSGDVAWGGNWFYLIGEHGQELALANVEHLTRFTWKIRQALAQSGVTGAGGHEIDHIELMSRSPSPGVDARNFVLCPGKAFDRSPCGTGTSAKLACLAADGALAPGALWVQESIIGSRFTASYRREGERIIPTIRGRAHVTAEATLIFDDDDPFRRGIR